MRCNFSTMLLFNTLTRSKEEFIPIKKGNVNIYCCGPTVYNYIHIGNARPIIIFDVLRRYLEFKHYNVNFIQNFTDIDDKIINIANTMNINYIELTKKFIHEYLFDVDKLNVKRATRYIKATETISDIINNIKKLLNKNMAYVKNNNVFFKTILFKNYGCLSNNKIDKLMTSKKNDKKYEKNNILDFALWKSSKLNEPGWDSPWGIGRPGWHIECSSIIKKIFDNTIDIHCGGIDLIFPHHENEIAQSETLNDYKLSNFWLHNGLINIEDNKLSKSNKNFFSLRKIAEKYGYNTIRLFLISSHYRSNINFNELLLKNTSNSLKRIKTFFLLIDYYLKKNNNLNISDQFIEHKQFLNDNNQKFFHSMDNDLNTPDALSTLFEFIKFFNIFISKNKSRLSLNFLNEIKNILQTYCNILGIFFDKTKKEFNDEIINLIKLRNNYRKNKDYKNSDILRKTLLDKYDIEFKDNQNGDSEAFFI